MKKFLALIMVVLTLMFMLLGCTQTVKQTGKTESDYTYITEKGEMVIGITLFAPMNYKEGGELIGFETEFATAVCEKLDVTPVFQEINWDSKEIELNAKNIDCVWNGMTITQDRMENMEITDAYMNNRQVMIVKSANLQKYSASVDGAHVVAEQGSAGEELALDDDFFKSSKFTAVDSQAKALLDVASGTSDVAVVDYVTSIGSIGADTDFSDLVVVESRQFSPEEYGIAFRKGSDMVPEINAAIDELTESGKLDEIAKKYKLDKLIIKK
ncbi:MAG: transporter substrate-binding domain-containing protein [Firmicutes bacterium]|nr:transporter substrate-binding domain-containing protein [Bacillota bacterium]